MLTINARKSQLNTGALDASLDTTLVKKKVNLEVDVKVFFFMRSKVIWQVRIVLHIFLFPT